MRSMACLFLAMSSGDISSVALPDQARIAAPLPKVFEDANHNSFPQLVQHFYLHFEDKGLALPEIQIRLVLDLTPRCVMYVIMVALQECQRRASAFSLENGGLTFILSRSDNMMDFMYWVSAMMVFGKDSNVSPEPETGAHPKN